MLDDYSYQGGFTNDLVSVCLRMQCRRVSAWGEKRSSCLVCPALPPSHANGPGWYVFELGCLQSGDCVLEERPREGRGRAGGGGGVGVGGRTSCSCAMVEGTKISIN